MEIDDIILFYQEKSKSNIHKCETNMNKFYQSEAKF